ICTAVRGTLICTAIRGALICIAIRGALICAAACGTLICTALRGALTGTAGCGTLMLAAARKSCLAFRTEAAPLPCKARLGSPNIRYRVTAEPEGIMSAGIANCLGRCRAQIAGHGQQSERHDCCEPNASHLNVLHIARSLCDPHA